MFTKRADLMSPTCVTVWYTVWYIHPLTAPPGYVVTGQEAYFREHKTRKKQINIDIYIEIDREMVTCPNVETAK